MIPTYESTAYLRQSLGAVIAQDRGLDRMQIEVVDDGSLESPDTVVSDIAGRRASVYHQPRHLGLIGNLNTCLERSRGDLIHILHADDWILPGFYEAMERLFDRHPEIGLGFCGVTYHDSDSGRESSSPTLVPHAGVLSDAFERILIDNPLTTAGVVVRRSVYERLGGFDRRLMCSAEDWEMWLRAALHSPVGYEPANLAVYRMMRPGSLTLSHMPSGVFATDMRKAHAIVESYMRQYRPGSRARQQARQAREATAIYITEWLAPQMFSRGNTWAGLTQLRQALLCKTSPRVLRAVMSVLRRSLLASS